MLTTIFGLSGRDGGLAANRVAGLRQPSGNAIRRAFREYLLTVSQDAAPQRQDAPGAAKIALAAVAALAALGCLLGLMGVAGRDGQAYDLTVVMFLSIGLAVGASFATWRYGLRRLEVAEQRIAAGSRAQADQLRYLRLMIDMQPDPVLLVDGQDRCVVANQILIDRAAVHRDDVAGTPMADIVPSEALARYQDLNRRARDLAKAQTHTHRSDPSDDYRVFRSDHIPIGDPPGFSGGVLILERDLTGIAAAQKNDARMSNQLIRALIKLLDGRDPFAAHHSAKVAIVAHAVAQELGLSDELASTAKMAGSLMNIGKILAPSDLLTREGALSDDERRRVRDGIQASADLVSHIDFPGPVVDTLRQVFEKWDGTGMPRGLKGDEILISAQVVSLANSFVAMISPRAHRGGISIDEATAALTREAGTTYGPDIVAALASRLRDRATLETIG